MKQQTILLSLIFICLAIYSNAQTDEKINSIDKALRSGQRSVSDVLSDMSLMSLHSLTAFRDIIKQNAKAGKIQLNTGKEPGVKITVNGIVTDKSGKPASNKLVYVYQTSSEGWYSDTAPHILQNEGDRRHARIFGYFKTGVDGRFEFTTIKPKGYPNSSLPAHIHIEIDLGDNHFISELLFDDDPRLEGDIRKRALAEGFIVSKNTGTEAKPVYAYHIFTKN
ncbi:MAG: hypothetical protein QM737_20155 [Ferruginibacter sp.]